VIAISAKSYRGVSCLRCGEPIPVSAKIVSPQDQIESSQTDAPGAFVARCRVCESENVYLIGALKTFGGEPRKRAFRARMAGA
jgi:hypothetical protein